MRSRPGSLGDVFMHRAVPQINEMGNHWALNKEDLMHGSYTNSGLNPYVNISLVQNGLFQELYVIPLC